MRRMRSPARAARRAKRQRRQERNHQIMWGKGSWCERRKDHQMHPADRNPPLVLLPRATLDAIFGVTERAEKRAEK